MSFFARLMSTYLLVLALIPCGDLVTDFGESLAQALAYGIETVHDDHDHAPGCPDDVCSPFCSCDCCSVVAPFVVVASLNVLAPQAIDYRRTVALSRHFISAEYYDIWQPPRVG